MIEDLDCLDHRLERDKGEGGIETEVCDITARADDDDEVLTGLRRVCRSDCGVRMPEVVEFRLFLGRRDPKDLSRTIALGLSAG